MSAPAPSAGASPWCVAAPVLAFAVAYVLGAFVVGWPGAQAQCAVAFEHGDLSTLGGTLVSLVCGAVLR